MSHTLEHNTRQKKPSFLKGVFFIVILVAIIAGLILLALSKRSAEGPLVITEAPKAISVDVQTVSLVDSVSLEESFSGLVVARRSSSLGFSGSGRIASIAVDVGDRVRRGQVLAYLDTRELQANLAAANANVAEAVANYALADATAGRQRTLLQKGHVSQQRVDEAVAQANAAQARIEAAKAQAEMINVSIDLASIRAPFNGTITERMVDEGVIAVPGAAMLELVEAGVLEASIGLPADVASELKVGETYNLLAGGVSVSAKLIAKTGIIDQSRRTVSSIFDLPANAGVEAGSIIQISVPRRITERGLWVPVAALSESSRGLWSVYKLVAIDGGWVTRSSLVEVLTTDGLRAFVRGTLRDGDRIVSDGLSRLVPGQAVIPVTREPQTAQRIVSGG